VAPSHPMIWLRNQMYRMLPYLPWKGAIANQPLRAANSIQLRDYQA
jgi:hypothetical protein